MKIKELYDPVFNITFYLSINASYKQINEYIKSRKDWECDWEAEDTDSGMVLPVKVKINEDDYRSRYLLWMREVDVPVLVHELLHLVINIFESRKIPIDHGNQETMAYYQEYWFKRVCKELGL